MFQILLFSPDLAAIILYFKTGSFLQDRGCIFVGQQQYINTHEIMAFLYYFSHYFIFY